MIILACAITGVICIAAALVGVWHLRPDVVTNTPFSKPTNTVDNQKDYKLTTNLIRSRLLVLLVRGGDEPYDKFGRFPLNLRPERRKVWTERIRAGDPAYVAIEEGPARKADKTWAAWNRGVGKDMPDSVRTERMDEIFEPCYDAIIEGIERAEGAK